MSEPKPFYGCLLHLIGFLFGAAAAAASGAEAEASSGTITPFAPPSPLEAAFQGGDIWQSVRKELVTKRNRIRTDLGAAQRTGGISFMLRPSQVEGPSLPPSLPP